MLHISVVWDRNMKSRKETSKKCCSEISNFKIAGKNSSDFGIIYLEWSLPIDIKKEKN